jgi:hypothetical protein
MYENKIDLIFIKMSNFLISNQFQCKTYSIPIFFYQNFGLMMLISIHFLGQTLYKYISGPYKKIHHWWHIGKLWKKTWPKHVSWKLSSKPKDSHFITNLKTLVVVFKFKPSFLTCVIILFLKPYSSKNQSSLLPMPILWFWKP